MQEAVLNEKGQITIPSSVRKKLGLKPGMKLRVYSHSSEQEVHLTPTGSIAELAGVLPKPKKAFSVAANRSGIRA